MAIGTGTPVTDPMTNATTASLFTVDASTWAPLTTGSAINIGVNGIWTPGGGDANGGAVRIGSTFTNDQYSQAYVYSVVSGGYFGLLLRGSTASGGSGYRALVSNTYITVYRWVNGASTTLWAPGSAVSIAAGALLYFQVVGNYLRLLQNNNVIWQYYDASPIASGAPGFAHGNANSNVMYNWQGGSAVADLPIFPGFCGVNAPTGFLTGSAVFTANTWKTFNLTTDPYGIVGPPPTASGLIISWAASTATRAISRPTGSTFNTQPPAGTGTTANQQGLIMTGVTYSGTPPMANFDLMLDGTGSGFYANVLGYFGIETVFFDPPITWAPTGTMTTASPAQIQWNALSAQIPSSGVAAIIANVWGTAALLLPSVAGSGEISKWIPTSSSSHAVLCGFGSGWGYLTADNSTLAPTVLVRGYVKSGITWENTAYDYGVSSTGYQWGALSSAASTAKATALLFQVRGTSNFVVAPFYLPSTAVTAYQGPGNGSYQCVIQTPWAYNSAAPVVDIGEQAYFNGVLAPVATVAPTTPSGYFSVRSTSQS